MFNPRIVEQDVALVLGLPIKLVPMDAASSMWMNGITTHRSAIHAMPAVIM